MRSTFTTTTILLVAVGCGGGGATSFTHQGGGGATGAATETAGGGTGAAGATGSGATGAATGTGGAAKGVTTGATGGATDAATGTGGGPGGAATGIGGGSADAATGTTGGPTDAATGTGGGPADAAVQHNTDAGVAGTPDADIAGAFIVTTKVEYGPDDLVEGPLAGVAVQLFAAPTCAPLVASGTTGQDGTVIIKVAPDEVYCLKTTPPALPTGTSWVSEPGPLSPVGPQRINFSFQTDARAPASALGPGNVSVLVTVKGAGPLPGATVAFARANSERCPDVGSGCPNCKFEYCIGGFVPVASPVTKSDGTLSIALPAGRYEVTTTAPAGWSPPWSGGAVGGSWSNWIDANSSVQLDFEFGPSPPRQTP